MLLSAPGCGNHTTIHFRSLWICLFQVPPLSGITLINQSQVERAPMECHRALSSVLPERRTHKALIRCTDDTKQRSRLKWSVEMKVGRRVNTKWSWQVAMKKISRESAKVGGVGAPTCSSSTGENKGVIGYLPADSINQQYGAHRTGSP